MASESKILHAAFETVYRTPYNPNDPITMLLYNNYVIRCMSTTFSAWSARILNRTAAMYFRYPELALYTRRFTESVDLNRKIIELDTIDEVDLRKVSAETIAEVTTKVNTRGKLVFDLFIKILPVLDAHCRANKDPNAWTKRGAYKDTLPWTLELWDILHEGRNDLLEWWKWLCAEDEKKTEESTT